MASCDPVTHAKGALGFAAAGRHCSGLRGKKAQAQCSVPQSRQQGAIQRSTRSSLASEGRPFAQSSGGNQFPMVTSEGTFLEDKRQPSVLSSRRNSVQRPSKLRAAASDEPMADAGRTVPQLIEGLEVSPVQGILAAILAVLLLTRLVNPVDIVLSVASFAYALFLGQWAVPPRADLPSAGLTPRQQLKDFGTAQWFQIYFKVFRVAGVLVPLLYSIAAFSLGEFGPAGLGFSYLFHLLSQILAETTLAVSTKCSLPGYFFVPILFNSGRLIRIWQWWQIVYGPVETATLLQSAFTTASQAVVTTLTVLWVVNLFCLLLPVSLPLGFKRYCGAEPIPGVTDKE